MPKKPDSEESKEPALVGVPATLPANAKFEFAVSRIKLARSLSYVNANQPGLKGAELEQAVKDRYVHIGGLLVEDKPERTGPHRKGLSHDVE